MTRRARSAVLRTTAMAFLLASALVVAGGALTATASTTPCPHGPAAVVDVEYVVFHLDGTSNDVSKLQGNVRLGDTVNALFNVPALPSGCPQVELSLASYLASGRHASHEGSLFASDTGDFLPGGRYEMSVTIAPLSPPSAHRVRFRLDFATGPVLMTPRYGRNLIASASG